MAFCKLQYVKYELLFSMENFQVRLMNELRRYHYNQVISDYLYHTKCKCHTILYHTVPYNVTPYCAITSHLPFNTKRNYTMPYNVKAYHERPFLCYNVDIIIVLLFFPEIWASYQCVVFLDLCTTDRGHLIQGTNRVGQPQSSRLICACVNPDGQTKLIQVGGFSRVVKGMLCEQQR